MGFEPKDALRVYVGDTRKRDVNGYLIEEKIFDEIYGDEELYKTLNILMFEGIENEVVRRREGTEFNIELLRRPEEILDIYHNLLELTFSSGIVVEEIKTYRYDREIAIKQLQSGFTKSFFSTSKGRPRSQFSYKIGAVEMEVKICPGVYCIDVENALGEEYNRGEGEVLIPPFVPIDIVEDTTYKKGLGVEKRYLINLKPQCLMAKDNSINIQNLIKSLCDSKRIKDICEDLQRINDGECDEKAVSHYIEWKREFQKLIKIVCDIKLRNAIER